MENTSVISVFLINYYFRQDFTRNDWNDEENSVFFSFSFCNFCQYFPLLSILIAHMCWRVSCSLQGLILVFFLCQNV